MNSELLKSCHIKKRYDKIKETQGIEAANTWLQMIANTLNK